ncbi:MAG: carboxypeptidase regulatory-like domain-containing protein, partial [Candidatus Diapherotrites archaeon]|nr:carboxypeptidase regulatory-like domain-containing protein [Candidatus Diapherotrites archaeon]
MPRRLERLKAQEAGAKQEKKPPTEKIEERQEKFEEDLPGESIFDRVDKRVFIAAFAAAIIIILILVFLPQQPKFELRIQNSQGALLQGVEVEYRINEISLRATTNADGKILIDAEEGDELIVFIEAQKINGIDYSELYSEFAVGNIPYKDVILKTVEESAGEITVIFKSPIGARITGKAITIKLSCANGFKPVPETAVDLDKDGQINITKSPNCSVLQAQLIAPGEFIQKTFTIIGPVEEVTLETHSEAAKKASLRVRIIGAGGHLIASTNFLVQLVNQQNFVVTQKNTLTYGEALFLNLNPGAYNIKVIDETGDYPITEDFAIVTLEELNVEKDITMEKGTKGTITVTVEDKRTGLPVKNASVQLLNAKNELVAEQTTGYSGAILRFYVKDAGTYRIIAKHDNYLYGEATVETSGDIKI